MPKGTAVEKEYQRLLRKGYSKSHAAATAQLSTQQSLKTGKHKTIKRRSRKKGGKKR